MCRVQSWPGWAGNIQTLRIRKRYDADFPVFEDKALRLGKTENSHVDDSITANVCSKTENPVLLEDELPSIPAEEKFLASYFGKKIASYAELICGI